MKHDWINRDLFPFESRYVLIDGHQMHYIDEGSGPVILFSHGTPEWSFGWRDLILRLRGRFRCIAPDLLGMGLSDKPLDADYSVQAHSERLTAFIQQLGLTNINLVANDFGLSIALGYAIRFPDNVLKISIFNGWMWALNDDPHYAGPARALHGWLGNVLYKYFNFPVTVIMPMAFGDRKKLSREVHRHYKRALPNVASRQATRTFARQVLDAGPWWAGLWAQREKIASKPFLVFWGMKDRFVPPYELEKWEKALHQATVIRLENAGHFTQEEAPDEIAEALANFLVMSYEL